jgi:hypothetical protein
MFYASTEDLAENNKKVYYPAICAQVTYADVKKFWK